MRILTFLSEKNHTLILTDMMTAYIQRFQGLSKNSGFNWNEVGAIYPRPRQGEETAEDKEPEYIARMNLTNIEQHRMCQGQCPGANPTTFECTTTAPALW
jgi:hypothetical protein